MNLSPTFCPRLQPAIFPLFFCYPLFSWLLLKGPLFLVKYKSKIGGETLHKSHRLWIIYVYIMDKVIERGFPISHLYKPPPLPPFFLALFKPKPWVEEVLNVTGVRVKHEVVSICVCQIMLLIRQKKHKADFVLL